MKRTCKGSRIFVARTSWTIKGVNRTEINGVSFYLQWMTAEKQQRSVDEEEKWDHNFFSSDCEKGWKQPSLLFHPTLTLPSRPIGRSFYPIFIPEGLCQLQTLGRKKRTPVMKRPVSGTRWTRTRLGWSRWWKDWWSSESWILNLKSKLSQIIVEWIPRVSCWGSFGGGCWSHSDILFGSVEKASLLGRWVMRVTSSKSTYSNPLYIGIYMYLYKLQA